MNIGLKDSPMRSALSFSLVAAAACAAVTCAAAVAQSATALSPAVERTVPFAAYRTAPRTTALAEASTAPSFSSSATERNGGESGDGTELALPDAPLAAEGQAGVGHAPSPQPIAPKYAPTVLPGQTANPLSAGGKIAFSLHNEVSPFTFLSRVVSATYSQGVDSQPHYGQGWAPYGQRIGAAFARGAVQDLATEAVFDNIFRDDPRYYILGRQHKVLNRAIYAATRVIITRTDSGHNTVNAPLLLGYAAAAGANFAYYPERDRNFGDAATGYAGSLGGGVLGFEVSEFLPDILRAVHLRRD